MKAGLTIKFAPAKIAILAVSGSRTVPAPSIISPFEYFSAKAAITLSAPGTVNVSSIPVQPPARQASEILIASSALLALTTATRPQSVSF